jgi:hypothetical protein
VGAAYGGLHVDALFADRLVLGSHVFHADDFWAAGVRVFFGSVVHCFDVTFLRCVAGQTFASDGHCARGHESSAGSGLRDWDHASFLFLAKQFSLCNAALLAELLFCGAC